MQYRNAKLRIATATLFVAAVGILVAKTTVSTYTATELPGVSISPGTPRLLATTCTCAASSLTTRESRAIRVSI
jgi:hypothetical protein